MATTKSKILTPLNAGIGISIIAIVYFLTRKKEIIPILPPIPPVPPKPDNRQGTKYSYGAQQYLNFAESLFTAMDGVGTNEAGIKRVMDQMKTYDDVLALIQAYGRRKWSKWEIWDLNPKPLTLAEALESELSASEINTFVNNPLRKTQYQF
jgi:hypothetical protein